MSDIQGSKAISAVSRGLVEEVAHARVFQMPSSDGSKTYTVAVTSRGDTCTCEAAHHGRTCYHLRAAHLYMAQQRGVPATAESPWLDAVLAHIDANVAAGVTDERTADAQKARILEVRA